MDKADTVEPIINKMVDYEMKYIPKNIKIHKNIVFIKLLDEPETIAFLTPFLTTLKTTHIDTLGIKPSYLE